MFFRRTDNKISKFVTAEKFNQLNQTREEKSESVKYQEFVVKPGSGISR